MSRLYAGESTHHPKTRPKWLPHLHGRDALGCARRFRLSASAHAAPARSSRLGNLSSPAACRLFAAFEVSLPGRLSVARY